jgi:hypothetical protein
MFHDLTSFVNLSTSSNKLIFLNLNIQCINSKYDELKNFVCNLSKNKVNVELIALQETWTISYPELLDIPGFQRILFVNRKRCKGGGVGFYPRNGLNYNVLDMPFCVFSEKIFKSLSLEITSNDNNVMKKYFVSSVYR